MIPFVLATHGSLGRELLETARSIVGDVPEAFVVSNADCSMSDLRTRLEKAVEPLAPGPAFLFIDLFGGSCSFAADALRRIRPETYIVVGVNLPMLIDFLHNRDRLPASELAERLVQKGRDGIKRL